VADRFDKANGDNCHGLDMGGMLGTSYGPVLPKVSMDAGATWSRCRGENLEWEVKRKTALTINKLQDFRIPTSPSSHCAEILN